MRPLLLAPVLVLAGGCIVIDEMECRHREERKAVVPLPANLSEVEVRALAGSLTVRGRAGATEVRVDGVACARRMRDRDALQIETRTDGDRIVIEAIVPENAARRGARLDLTIEVPASARVEIDDGRGDIEIEDLAAAEVIDGSGDLLVRRVVGVVSIRDESGDIVVDGAAEVRVDDHSGDIAIERAGTVTIINDDSGDIEILTIAGDVTILDDGSGDIEILDVDGNLKVEDDGSGDLDYAGVKGIVDVPQDASQRSRGDDDD